MAIVKLKSKDQKISELLRFTLPSVDYIKGYQTSKQVKRERVPNLTGGSAPLSPEKAVNELIKWTIAIAAAR